MIMVSREYARGFVDALEYALNLFNKLFVKEKLDGRCKDCNFVHELGRVMELAKDKQFEKLEEELGYYLR